MDEHYVEPGIYVYGPNMHLVVVFNIMIYIHYSMYVCIDLVP